MKKIAFYFSLVLVLGLFSCSKEKANADARAQIRVVNKTALPLTDVIVGNEDYGTVAPFQTSVYHTFTNLSSYVSPKLTFYNDKIPVEHFIGYCGTPPLPEPSNLQGSFTYTIVPDDSNSLEFRFNFTKD